ncbi:MAG: hypothetical protein ACR2IS_08195 [Nitrososphaeraceae archaeon]
MVIPIALFAWQEIRRRCDCYFITSKAFCERFGLQLRALPLPGEYKARIRENLISTKKEAAGDSICMDDRIKSEASAVCGRMLMTTSI